MDELIQSSSQMPSVVPPKKLDRRSAYKLVPKKFKKITPAQGLEILDYLLQKSFPPERINAILQDLVNASDTKTTKSGEFYQTPNWLARVHGLTQALKLKRFTSSQDGEISSMPITKITFNVVNNVNVNDPKQVVEVPHETPMVNVDSIDPL